MKNRYRDLLYNSLKCDSACSIENCTVTELYSACCKALNGICNECKQNNYKAEKRAAYFSAEYLTGNLLKAGLYNFGILEDVEEILNGYSRSIDEFDNISDPGLGNGGLGRLAACYLDSAACISVPLDGYGIRYKYGLFEQKTGSEGQKEYLDNWQKDTDSLGICNRREAVTVKFSDMTVKAVPYDYYVPGLKGECINRLRLYESEPFDDCIELNSNDNKVQKAKEISDFLYPDDSMEEGKILRIRQQYFFCSAALQSIVSDIIKNGKDLLKADNYTVIQLNDTHPAVAIPEFIRIITEKGYTFDEAFELCKRVFAYTNHTVMPEALEKWSVDIYSSILPEIYAVIKEINNRLTKELNDKGVALKNMLIIENGMIHLARLCVFCCFSVNGVASIHTDILKNSLMHQWFTLYPKKFSNKTNGVTQRRWLGIANRQLSEYINSVIGDDCIKNIQALEQLKKYSGDKAVQRQLEAIRIENKQRLCNYILNRQGVDIKPEGIFFVQVKRIHEYKRQLMNALSIVQIYSMIKNGSLKPEVPLKFIIGGKAAPSYENAKLIIKYINRLAEYIDNDEDVKNILQVIYIENYDVSYAEKIIPAADFSEQISLVTTEASGTGNMKFMMNGAVTIGTYDGANVEIAKYAGKENCIIFGMNQDEYKANKSGYKALDYYEKEVSVKKAVDTLKDENIDYDGEASKLYDILVHEDKYMVLKDLNDFTKARLDAIRAYSNKGRYWSMSINNIASSAYFSSDRAVREYAEGVWFNTSH